MGLRQEKVTFSTIEARKVVLPPVLQHLSLLSALGWGENERNYFCPVKNYTYIFDLTINSSYQKIIRLKSLDL